MSSEGERVLGTNLSESVLVDRPVRVRMLTIGPGATPELKNEEADDTFYVAEGNGDVRVDGRRIPLEPGSTGVAPKGAAYVFSNASPGNMVIVSILRGSS